MEDPSHEWVLLVPPKLAQSSHAILVQADCVARPWHFEGRFGSRTHKDKGLKIGIPVISKQTMTQQAQHHAALERLLEEEGVELVWKEFTPSNRAIRTLPHFDARIHPERSSSSSTDHYNYSYNVTTTKDNKPHFTYIDLFAGTGGFAVALDALGGACVLASEIDPACQRLYAHNFPTAPLVGDIYGIQAVNKKGLAAHEKIDLLVGGFPCQPFSALGQQPGLDCQKGNLFLEIVRLLRAHRPSAFLLENVPGLLAMKDTFTTIKTALQEAGYDVTCEVCNARGLTATSRKRLFLVGLLKKHGSKNKPSSNGHDHNTEEAPFDFPYVPDLQLKAHNVVDYTNAELSKLEQELLPLSDHQMQQLNKCKRWKPADLAWPNTVCDTLVSHYGNSITRGESQLVPCSASFSSSPSDTSSNSNPRRFSPRECLRIMGFPNAYNLPARPAGSVQGDMAFCKEQYRMAGNAVCPPLMAALAGAVLDRVLQVPPPQSQRDDHDDKQHQQQQSMNWVEWGRHVAVDLAYQATRTGRPNSNKNKQGTKRDFDDSINNV